MAHLPRLAYGAALSLTGCVAWPETEKTAQVSGQFFESATTSAVTAKPNLPQADDTMCIRVDVVGRKLVAENPQIGMRPLFWTVGVPTPELFHVEQRFVVITEGLVKQLPSEADLAAALSYELARMVAEREARVKHDMKVGAARPPIQLPIGGGAGPMAATDMASTAELAKYDKQRRDRQQAPSKLNPETLARNYLEEAGYLRTDFDRVQPFLQAADRNSSLERQIKGISMPNAWTR
jgi:predicted Zn-dependent protease